tara:strand:- start:162 stop:353 length:192 start_codon:yes stop_codon:yes gene_type:complete
VVAALSKAVVEAEEAEVVIKTHTVSSIVIPMLLVVEVVEDNVMALLEVLVAEEMEQQVVLPED